MTDPYGISKAVRPWVTMEGPKHKPIQTYDSPEQMARCQECPYPDCVDCVGSGAKDGPRAEKAAKFMALYEAGLTDRQIAQVMGVTHSTIVERRIRRRLPPNWAQPKNKSLVTPANQ